MLRDGSHSSPDYRGLESIAQPFTAPLPAPPAGVSELRFETGSLASLRGVLRECREAASLSADRREELVLAVNELASNSILHGGGGGVVRIWRDRAAVVCELTDGGRIADPLAGRVQQPPGKNGGYGLWIANQVCDLVQIRSSSAGTTVRLRMKL